MYTKIICHGKAAWENEDKLCRLRRVLKAEIFYLQKTKLLIFSQNAENILNQQYITEKQVTEQHED